MRNVLDHDLCDQHKVVMSQLCTAQAKARKELVTSYAPIACTLLMLDESKKGRMRCKFDLCCLMAKEGIVFQEVCKKYVTLYVVEAHHDVTRVMPTKPLCQQSYSHTTLWNPNVSSSFKPFKTKLYSFLTDGSTDAGNV